MKENSLSSHFTASYEETQNYLVIQQRVVSIIFLFMAARARSVGGGTLLNVTNFQNIEQIQRCPRRVKASVTSNIFWSVR